MRRPTPARRTRVAAAPEWLLLDCGNSRIKWARMRLPFAAGQRFLAAGAMELADLAGARAALPAMLRNVPSGTRVLVCNVAGSLVRRAVQAAVRRAGLSAPTFVRSSARAAGVRNGYREAWRLGVDRWVALIGARHEFPGMATCIVGVGSAMTIDLLDAEGGHRGGCIIPGPRMMIESLLQNTAGIRRRAELRGSRALTQALALSERRGGARNLFARDTRAALLAGARYACAGLVECAVVEATRRLDAPPRLILAGGAAEPVGSLLRGRVYRQRDDLVLRGLAVLAASIITTG